MPFSSNSTAASLKVLKVNIPAYRFFFLEEDSDMPDLVAEGIGCSDKSWNMICLNKQLHTWWSKCLLGIKCTGVTLEDDMTNSTVWLEFQWMCRRTPLDPGRKISIDNRAQDMPGRPHTQESEAARFVKGTGAYYGDAAVNPGSVSAGHIMDFISPSGRPLLSGHRFQNTMANEEAGKMKAMIDLQWACVNIASMSGAADWPPFTDDDEDGEDDARVSVWVQETSFASLTEMPSNIPGRKDETGAG